MAENHHYGETSLARLRTCHPYLQLIAPIALERSPYDITIIHGHRKEMLQNALFEAGASKVRYPNSKHNRVGDDGEPRSEAIDIGPWVDGRVPWDDTHVFAVVAGVFLAVAMELKIPLRWGGDWDGDGSTKDQTLLDWGHLELELN